jgi:nucleoside-diphosphate-sugar epimerase
MKAIVFGATGFIGIRLVGRLLSRGIEIVCTGRSLEKLNCCSGKIKAVYLDIRDREKVRKVLFQEKPDVVFHCAAQTNNLTMSSLREVNVKGTENIFDACLRAEVEKVVYLSSISVIAGNKCKCYTDKLPYKARNRYGESKIEAEKIAEKYRKKGLKIAILRPSMVYGEGDPHKISLVIKLLSKRLLPIIGSGENKYSLVYIENVIDVIMLSVFKDSAYESTYIIADKEIVSLKDLFLYIAKLLNAKRPWFLPSWISFLIVKFPFVGSRIKVFCENNVCSIDNLKKRLNYIPKTSLYEGFRRTVEAYKNMN